MNSYKRRRAASRRLHNRLSSSSVPDLAQDEWDFSGCPADELWECRAYEFAREIQGIRDVVDSLRKNLPCTFEALVNALRSRVQSMPLATALFWYSEFPDKPYLTIPVAERRRRFRLLWPGSATAAISITPKIIPPDIRQRLASGRVLYGWFELVLFELNWTESDTYLMHAFSEWLKEHRPPDVKVIETRGAGNFLRGFADDLKALGALRLLKKMKWHDAFTLTREVLGKERVPGRRRKCVALYGDREEVWRKAKQRADRLIAQMSSGLSRLYISKRID